MSGINKAIVVGNLGRDPEVKYTTGNVAVANFTVATSEKWKDKSTGELQEKTEWHRIVAWRELAESCGKYLRKGSKVYLEGKLETRKWTDSNEVDHYSTEIIAQKIEFLDPREKKDTAGTSPSNAGGGQQDDDEDSLPF